MKENDLDIVELIMNNMPIETEMHIRIKSYMETHKELCNDFIYKKYAKETTFFNTILKSLTLDLSSEIVRNFANKNRI